jgi:hypothetical protein
MRYLSIDIETTGLDERNCQTLQFAAVYDDTSKILAQAPTINLLIKHELYSGEPFALALNRDIFETLANLPQYYGTHYIFDLPRIDHHGREVKCVTSESFGEAVREWIKKTIPDYLTVPITLTGKNAASFDLRFLRRLDGWRLLPFSHRLIDPGSLYLRPHRQWSAKHRRVFEASGH